MKKMLIIGITLAAILAIGISEQFWVRDNFVELEQRTTQLIEKAQAGTLTDEEMEEVNDWWNGKKRILNIFIPHDEIRDIDYWLSEATGYVQNRHYDLALAQFAIMLDASKTIPLAFQFRIENIF